MKKVLFMANTLYSGGAERVLQTILNQLNEKKYDITLYSLHREKIDHTIYKKSFRYKVLFDNKYEKIPLINVIYRYLTKLKGYIFTRFSSRLFYFLFVRGKYDVEIAFIEGESTKIISGSTNKASKKIAWVHTDLESNPWTSFLYQDVKDEAKHYNCFDKIICVSQAARDSFERKYNINSNKIIMHYNPIDADYIRQQATECDVDKLFKKNVVQVMAVGRLVKEKGFDRLLIAAYNLKMQGFEFQLHIIGTGDQYELLQNYISKHNLQEYVILHGYQINPYSLMKKGDVLICSSRAEGYSLVIAEAMILGLAIITTPCSGPCELVQNGQYGLLVDNSVDGIFNGLKAVISDHNLLDKYKMLSIDRSTIFDIHENIRELERIIDE